MRAWRRVPLRLRLTLLFVPGMALMLAAVAVFTIHRMDRDLLDTVDAGLRSRAEIMAADVRTHAPTLPPIQSDLIESDEAFAQITDETGAVVQSSPIVAAGPMLPANTLRSLREPAIYERRISGIDGTTRILAVPVIGIGGHWTVVAGASLQDRRDQIVELTRTLGVALPIGLLAVAVAGWALTGGALRPVERMRADAAAIATTDLRGRLSPGPADDEIARLGGTLNSLLDRVQDAVERERRLVDNASHELRTPLSILRSELELALARQRTVGELEAALRSASEETDKLVRLAEDLLVLSRARDGDLPVRKEAVPLRTLVDDIVARHNRRALAADVIVDVHTPTDAVYLDAARMRQAVDNLLDNAIRHTPPGGRVDVRGEVANGTVRLTVSDTGGGFAEDVITRAFEPFIRGADHDGPGLGLAIVKAIAEAHGGAASAANRSGGGASVVMTLPNRG